MPYTGTTVTRLNRRIVDELIYERTAVEAKVLRDFTPKCTPEQRALIRVRVDAYETLARAEAVSYTHLRLKKTLCRSSQRKRRTQLLLLSDPPRRAFGLDYDPCLLYTSRCV